MKVVLHHQLRVLMMRLLVVSWFALLYLLASPNAVK